LRAADAEGAYHAWMNDPEVTRYLESRFRPHSVESLREFIAAQQRKGGDCLFLALTLREGGRHIGNIKLEPIDWVHRRGEVGILIGDRSYWGKGYATEAIELLTAFAFRTLNLHKLTAGAYSVNVGSVRAFEKAGYVREGLRPSHCWCNGAYVDLVLLGKVRGAGE
jgi:RimJ/RimL family protein N-acetyltransferase